MSEVITLDLFRMEEIGLSLDDMVASAHRAIQSLFDQNRPVCVAYSGGKDSSVVASLALNAAREYVAAGRGQPLIVTCMSDTLVDNPETVSAARQEMARMAAYAKRFDIRLQTAVVTPNLAATWQLKILSGRGIPSYAGTSTDCTTDMKIVPQKAFRRRLFRQLVAEKWAEPVICIGTRFDESQRRALNMKARGERAETPVRNKDQELVLSPICYWPTDMVWEYLGFCSSGLIESYSDFRETLRIYSHSAGTSCAVVAESIHEGRAKKGGCGARHGCFVCQQSEDKSLSAMVEMEPRYEYARGLTKLNRYLRAIRHDWRRRHWVGRTIHAGYIAIQPDTFHPAEVRRLTRFILQLDHDERVRARRAGEAPKFEILPLQIMVAVDSLQSLNGIAEPFAIWKDYDDISQGRVRYDIPEIETVPETPLPDAKFLFVGKEWDSSADSYWTGMRDVYVEGLTGEAGCTPALQATRDGNMIWAIDTELQFSVHAESVAMMMMFEMDQLLQKHKRPRIAGAIGEAYKWYLQYGALSLSHSQKLDHDETLRRTAYKDRLGLTLDYSIEDLLARAVPFSALPDDARKAWAHKATTSSAQAELGFAEAA